MCFWCLSMSSHSYLCVNKIYVTVLFLNRKTVKSLLKLYLNFTQLKVNELLSSMKLVELGNQKYIIILF